MTTSKSIPAVSFQTARTGASAKANAMGMRPMQERAYNKRGEQYLLIKSPPASGKSRALMFIALDKLNNQGLRQAIIVVPERSIGSSFADEPLTQHGFYWDWQVAPQWNLCNAPGLDEERVDPSKIKAVGQFLASDDRVLVCTHATFRFAVEQLGVDAFDNRLIAVDEFHHVSAHPDNRLGSQLAEFMQRDKAHIVAMTGSYFRGDAAPVLSPEDESKFETVTYTYYEQLNGYEHLKALNIGYFFYTGRYLTAIEAVLDPSKKTIVHIPSVNSRESLKDKHREAEDIMQHLGEWEGVDPVTGFHLIRTADGGVIRVADLKTRAGRSERIAAEMGAKPGTVMQLTEFMHPRAEEIAALTPGARVVVDPVDGGLDRPSHRPQRGDGLSIPRPGRGGGDHPDRSRLAGLAWSRRLGRRPQERRSRGLGCLIVLQFPRPDRTPSPQQRIMPRKASQC